MYKLIISCFMLLSFQTFGQVDEYILNNGLKVIVKEDHRAPIAVSMMWYNVGSADEPGGISGVSHAMEHMMFKGTKKFPLGVFSKTIASLGGQDNAFTSNDYTAYFEKTHASKLAINFELEADRMNNLLLDPKEFSKEIKVIQEERRMRTDDNPQALALERFLATAHLAAPYNHPVIGWMTDLHKMKVEDLRAWYRKYYAPNNATLVVVGDVDSKKVHLLAKQYFEAIPKRAVSKRKPQLEPQALGKKVIQIQAPAQLPLLIIGYTVPGIKTAEKSWEPYALEIISGILDAGDGARFAKNLIRGSRVAAGTEISYNPHSRYQTQFIIYGSPSENVPIKGLRYGFLTELNALKNTLVDPKELQRIKNQLIAQKTFEKDSIFGQAMELGLLETLGIGWQHTDNYTQSINSITPEQIQQTAQRYFNDENRTEAELKPTKPHGVNS